MELITFSIFVFVTSILAFILLSLYGGSLKRRLLASIISAFVLQGVSLIFGGFREFFGIVIASLVNLLFVRWFLKYDFQTAFLFSIILQIVWYIIFRAI